MIECKCDTRDTLKVVEMVAFQGALKKRTDKDIDALVVSLKEEGLLMPFAIWQSDKNYVLDGHGRREAIIRLALEMPDILMQEFPVLVITADNEEGARKALLQITSTYGRFSKAGVVEFAKTLPNYRAPVIKYKVDKGQGSKKAEKEESPYTVLKLDVEKGHVAELRDLLDKIEWIRIR